MIRLICVENNAKWAAQTGEPISTRYRSFDFELPEFEKWLAAPEQYSARAFVGIEVLPK